MNLGELRLALRQRLDDQVATYLWSDASLNQFLNKAVDEACLRARLLLMNLTYNLPANKNTIEIAERLFYIDRISWPGQGELIKTGMDYLDMIEPLWETQTNDYATHYLFDYQAYPANSQVIMFYPIPTTAGKLRIIGVGVPDPMVADTDEPAIEELHHFDLLDWASYLAYLINDADAGNLDKAKFFENAFTQKFGPKPENRRVEIIRKYYNRRVIGRYF